MKVAIVHSSPNREGLTAACANAAAEGVRSAGGEAEVIRLNDLEVGLCQACNTGWGICRSEHRCTQEDDFNALHERLRAADAWVLVTPVYFGDLSESMRAFTDRLRRCERRAVGPVKGKPVVFVAAAGGSGGGTTTCLLSFDRLAQAMGLERFDFISVTRRSRPYKLEAIHQAAKAMAEGK